MPFSFAEQFKRIFGRKKSPQLSTPAPKDFLAQQRAQGLQTKAPNQLPAVEEQVDISETITPIAEAQPLPPTGVGTTPTAGGQVGVPTQPLPPGGVSLATTTAAPPLGGITAESLAQFRELMGQQRTPEMIEEEAQTRQLLEQLIPFRQQLAQAQAPTEAIGELDVQIGELQRQIKRTKPEALVGRAETLAGAELEARARRAPVQTELTELLFQRSALGQRRAAEAERAQAGITAIGEEMDIRKAMAQLDPPAPLSPGIQTELFKRAFPGAAKAPSISEQIRLSETYGVGFGTPTSELLGRRPVVKPTTQQKRETGYEVIGELVETTPGGTYEELFATARRHAPNLNVGDVRAALEEEGVIKGGSNLTDEMLKAIAQEQWDIVVVEEGWFEDTASLQEKTLAKLEDFDELETDEGDRVKLSRQQRMKINQFVKLLKQK